MKHSLLPCAKRLLALAGLLLLWPAAPSFAQSIPAAINFQGRLAKPDGTPVPDNASQSVTFRLFLVAGGGSPAWSQTSNVAVRNGAFSAALDFLVGYVNGNTLASTFGTTYFPPYLEIQVGGDPPLAPRQPLRSVPYALYAGSVPDGSITAGKLAAGAVNFSSLSGTLSNSQIAAGTITADKLAPSVLNGAASTPLMNINAVLTGSGPRASILSGAYLYVVNTGSSTLQIFDASTPAQPILLGTAATAASPIAIAVSGNYAFVVSGGSPILQIFDVTTKTAPVLVGSAVTSANPNVVAVSGNFAYVVTSGGNNLQIFNIATKTAPTLAGAIGGCSSPVDVIVSGNYAYVLNFDNSTLQVFNVASPTAPFLAGSAATGANPYRMALSGATLYMANYGSSTLSAYSLASPAAPALLSTTSTSGQPYAIAVSGLNVYVTSAADNMLAEYSVSGAAPVLIGSVSTGSLGDSIAVSGNYVFVGVSGQNFLRVYQNVSPGLTVPNLAVKGVFTVQNGIGATDGALPINSSLLIDPFSRNIGTLTPAIVFGYAGSGEGIGSTRASGVNQYGLNFFANSLNRMVITNGGRVGIGNTAPAYPLDVTGDINARGVVRANGTALTSDSRYKTNIAPLHNALDDVLALRGVSYDWDRARWPEKQFSDVRQFGFIAQELEKIFPELVFTDAQGYKSVNYVGVVPVLVEAVKAQQKQLDAQHQEIEEIKKQMAELLAERKKPASRP